MQRHGGNLLPTREGFGSRLLQRVLTDQIDAEVTILFEPDGLRVTVELPLLDEPQQYLD